MKYPYIGESEANNITLFTDEKTGFAIKNINFESGSFRHNWSETAFTNITREYLSNTWGVVESKEHAEQINSLSEGCGGTTCGYGSGDDIFWFEGLDLYFGEKDNSYVCIDGKKQITIPLPPKAVENEWPQVGDEVTWGEGVVSGEVKAISEGLAWIKNEYGNYCSEYIASLKKPKTPEEEIEHNLIDLIMRARDADADDVTIAKSILSKYNITKRGEGDE